jgi:hypothetical protein
MVINYPDMLLVLRNFAYSYGFTPQLEEEVDKYIFACLKAAVEEHHIAIPAGGTVVCILEKEDILQNLPQVPILVEGMKMLFDIFGNEKHQLQVQYTEKEYREKSQ